MAGLKQPQQTAPKFEEGAVYRDSETGVRAKYSKGQWEILPEGDFSARRMMGNIPSSMQGYAQDMVSAVTHPVQTAKALGNVAMGAAQLAIPEEQGKEHHARAVAEAIKMRYGSMDAFKATLEHDPVGVIADVSGALMAGGAALSAVPGKVGQIADKAARVGASFDPVSLAANTAKQPARMVPKGVSAELYDRAVKWPTRADVKHGQGTRAKMTDTALREGLTPDDAGIVRMMDIKAELNQKLDAAIDAAGDKPLDVNGA